MKLGISNFKNFEVENSSALVGGATWLCIDSNGGETCVEASSVIHSSDTECYRISIDCAIYNEIGPTP